jgi:alpha-tubulin suppressor-like RCC1 family protein
MRKPTAIITAAIVTIGLTFGAPTLAHAKKKPTPISVGPAVTQRQHPITLAGSLPTKVVRPVQAQYKAGKKWKKLAATKTAATGAYSFTITTTATKLSVRVVAKKVKIKKKRYAKITTKTRKITTTRSTDRLISAGSEFACDLTAVGGVRCWGANDHGQLGNGHLTSTSFPQTVVGLSSGVVSVATGSTHTCALTVGGSVLCWGENTYGQLGNGTTANRTAPTPVDGLTSGVVAIAAGGRVSCAVTAAGAVLCWGYNGYGTLGDGTTHSRLTPTPVANLTTGATAVAVGLYHACALVKGAELCWGRNDQGQLGDGSTTDRLLPAPVTGLGNKVSAISAGLFTSCAVANGAAKCWGNNENGAVGDGTKSLRWQPTQVAGLTSGIALVETGGYHTCAVDKVGTSTCWGDGTGGQLGQGSTTSSTSPVQVFGLTSAASSITAGGAATCAVVGGGEKCWGINTSGQLGTGYTASSSTPLDVLR